jgi:hypothetical protein
MDNMQKDGKRADAISLGLAGAIVLAIVLAFVTGCSDSSTTSCIDRGFFGKCLDPVPVPTPVPTPACQAGGCPIFLSIQRLAAQPNVATVTAIPAGPFDLFQNGRAVPYPSGIAIVNVGDVVSACRCCGCSVPYLVF